MGIIDRIKRNRTAVYIVIGIVVVISAVTVYTTFFFTQECGNFACFQQKMQACERGTTYINDDKQATWQYKIQGSPDDGTCNVKVTLLQAKTGELELNKLIGESMNCYYPMDVGTYPEHDLDKCTGILKEGLQTLIINKLHAHIIDNLGQVAEGVEGI